MRRFRDESNLLIVIPARGGSKGLPGKNLKAVSGISLVARAVLTARHFARLVPLRSATILVDTDSPAIAREGQQWGAVAPFLRPAHLALDDTPTIDSVLHVAQRITESGQPVDVVMLLQPTSPLRAPIDLQQCWQEFDVAQSPSVISVVASPHPIELALRIASDRTVSYVGADPPRVSRRQAFPTSYFPNGAVYVATLELLRERRAFVIPGITKGVLMPVARSVDVDTREDLAVADAIDSRLLTRGFPLGRQVIGRGRCFLIADASQNRGRDFALTHRLVDAVADAGADALALDPFDAASGVAAENQAALLRHAADRGLACLCSQPGAVGTNVLHTLGISGFKIAVSNIQEERQFLRDLAGTGRPMLVTPATHTVPGLADIADAVRSQPDPPFAFLLPGAASLSADTCTLRDVLMAQSAIQVPVGWSDAGLEFDLSLAAVASGAHLLEKRITFDQPSSGTRDKMPLNEFRRLASSVRTIEASLMRTSEPLSSAVAP